jgi:hypothetical protein
MIDSIMKTYSNDVSYSEFKKSIGLSSHQPTRKTNQSTKDADSTGSTRKDKQCPY